MLILCTETALHFGQLAKAWNIDIDKLPYHGYPTHVNDLYNFVSPQ